MIKMIKQDKGRKFRAACPISIPFSELAALNQQVTLRVLPDTRSSCHEVLWEP